ncbi:MAG: M48 family metalloprotease [Nitriliruptor sp.]|uniref:M48 family metalloprotease n=1 Tax=Nitriliruptor sp. TaxID=2448056 RepID=UPI0034A0619A
MTADGGGAPASAGVDGVLSPREDTEPPAQVRIWAAVAVGLALVGVAATIWRPVAPRLPSELPPQASFDAALLATIDRYRTPRVWLAPVVTALAVLVPAAIASSSGAARLATFLTGDRTRAAWRGGVVAACIAAVTWLVALPIVAWVGLVHEGRWGFRTSTSLGWFRDQVLVAGGRWLAVGIGVVALLAARDRWPRSWPYRLTLAATVAALVLVVVHPIVLQPLLLRTEPLPAGPARDAIEDILAGAGHAATPVLVADASRRTTRVNAMVTGLGPTERVIVYDTLLELPAAQVAAVVAHELAHREHADVLRGTALTAVAALVGLLALRAVVDAPASRRRTRARSAGDPRLVPLIVAVAAVLELVGTPVGAAVSRRVEAAADHRALELGTDPAELVRTVRTFVVRDLAIPEPERPIQLLYGTHPSPSQRLRAAAAAAEARGTSLPSIEDLQREERTLRHPLAPIPDTGTGGDR